MDKNCGPCRVCHRDTKESEVHESFVGHDEFECKNCRGTKVMALSAVLDRVFKFPHNVNPYDLLRHVYGKDTETNMSYLKSKEELIDKKGFTWWYCDLDVPNREKVIIAMLDRYPELGGLLA